MTKPGLEMLRVFSWFNLTLLFSLTSSVNSMRVLSFNSTGDKNQLSQAVLMNNPDETLPEKFIFCFAVKQDKIDGTSPLLIRDRNMQPWIAVSIWKLGAIALWFEIGKSEWIKFHRIKNPWKFWSHICAGIDTVSGNISVSIDGRPTMTKTSTKLREGLSPGKLDQQLELGVTETGAQYGGRRQFYGMVSNIQFHLFDQKSSQLSILSRSSCATKGNYLAWPDMTFSRFGPGAFQLDEDEDEVCDVLPDFYDIFLPAKTSWTYANHLCEVLGGGMMTGVEDDQEMRKLAKRVKGISESCPSLWMPVSDAKKEGFWENTNTNSQAKFLPWTEGQPNGLETQNYVALETENFEFGDTNKKELHCSSCTLKTNAVLNLRGVCEDSLLGDFTCKNV